MSAESRFPANWSTAQLGDLFQFVIGGDWGQAADYPDPDYVTVRCIRASEVKNWNVEKGSTAAIRRIKKSSLQTRQLKKGDIVIEISGGGPDQPVGRTLLIDDASLAAANGTPTICTNFFRLARPFTALEPSYLNFFLNYFYKGKEMGRYQAGSNNLRNLKFKEYLTIEVPLAPKPEQRRIVAKIEELFSELDKGVESLLTAREQLKAYRQSVLKHAFEGKLTADWRAKNRSDSQANSSRLESLANARKTAWKDSANSIRKGIYQDSVSFDDTDPPNVPSDWPLVSIDALSQHITSGSRAWTQYYDRGESTFIMAQNVRPGIYNADFRQQIDPPVEDAEAKRTRVFVDDLLVTIVGANTGNLCRFNINSTSHYVCQSVALVRLVFPQYARFLELYFQAETGGLRQFKRYIYGAGRPHLSFDQLKQTVAPLPDLKEALLIVQRIEECTDRIESMESCIANELSRVTILRQAILQYAFSGRLLSPSTTDQMGSVHIEQELETQRTIDANCSHLKKIIKKKNQ